MRKRRQTPITSPSGVQKVFKQCKVDGYREIFLYIVPSKSMSLLSIMFRLTLWLSKPIIRLFHAKQLTEWINICFILCLMARSMPEEVLPQKARTTLSVGVVWDNKYLQLKFPSESRSLQMKKKNMGNDLTQLKVLRFFKRSASISFNTTRRSKNITEKNNKNRKRENIGGMNWSKSFYRNRNSNTQSCHRVVDTEQAERLANLFTTSRELAHLWIDYDW